MTGHWIRYGLFMSLRIAVLVYLGLLTLVAFGQRKYIYYPQRAPEGDLFERAARHGLAPWKDDAGTVIGWRTRRPLLTEPRRRMLVFHGNAGFALHRTYYVTGLSPLGKGFDWSVVLFEYPGYGARAGQPSEPVIKEAALSAARQLLAEDDRPLYLLGESLGGAVAAHVAGRLGDRIAGVVMITPMTRLADVAAAHYRFFPVRWLLREHYDAVQDIALYRGPLAVLLAGQDEVVPARLGQALYDGYTGPKRLWVQAEQTHNTLDLDRDNPWWDELHDFLTRPSKEASP